MTLSLEPERVLVLHLFERGVLAKLRVLDNDGKAVTEGQYQDLYNRRRLLLTHEHCNACVLSLAIRGKASDRGSIVLTSEILDKRTNAQRFAVEKLMHQAYLAEKNSTPESYRDALKHYLEAIDLWRLLGDTDELKNAYYLAGEAASGFAKSEARPDLYRQSLKVAEQSKDWFAAARNEIALGRYFFLQSRFDDAQMRYERAMSHADLALTEPDTYQQDYILGIALHELSQVYVKRGDIIDSQQIAERALGHLKNTNDSQQMANVLNTMGFLARQLNELDKAATYHELAFKLSDGDMHRGLRMRTLYYLGVVAAIRGRYFYGLQLLERAREEAEKRQTVLWQGHIMAARARINMELGRLQESASLYAQTRKFYEAADAQADLLTVALNLGRLYSKLGDADQSRHYFERAGRDINALGEEHRLSLMTAEVGAFIRQGDLSRALEKQVAIKALLKNSKNRFAPARSLTQLAEIHSKLNEHDTSLTLLRDAREQQRQNGDDLYFTKSSYLAAVSAYALERPVDEINTYLEEAIALIESIRQTLVNDELRQQFFALQKAIYELKTALYLTEGRMYEKDAVTALINAESFRARTLYESLLEKSDDTHLLPGERKRREGYFANWKRSLGNNDGLGAENRLLQLVLEQLSISNAQHDHVLYEPLRAEDIDDFRQRMSDREGLLFFFAGEQRSFLWLIGKNVFDVYTLPAVADIGRETAAFVTQIGTRPSATLSRHLWRDLHQARDRASHVILGQLAEALDSFDHLIVIPDGPLHKIPFSALYHPKTQMPLVLTHTISYGVSISTDRWLQRATEVAYEPGALLLIANPQGRVANLMESASPSPLRSRPLRSGELGSLPFAEQEARAVASFWSDKSGIRSLHGQMATKQALYSSSLEDYEVLHFATHALVNWDYPSLSAISLASENADGLGNHNLTVQEITQWAINAELVVLSGCDTASGKEMLGEGPIGLSRAFFEAGSKRVVASLWPVEDESSAHLMQHFYQNLLHRNHTPAEALRRARLNVSQNAKWSHPYYWSSFIFIGNRGGWREH